MFVMVSSIYFAIMHVEGEENAIEDDFLQSSREDFVIVESLGEFEKVISSELENKLE